MRWRIWRKPEPCRYCNTLESVVRIKVTGNHAIWVCRQHTDNALDDIIRHWKEVGS